MSSLSRVNTAVSASLPEQETLQSALELSSSPAMIDMAVAQLSHTVFASSAPFEPSPLNNEIVTDTSSSSSEEVAHPLPLSDPITEVNVRDSVTRHIERLELNLQAQALMDEDWWSLLPIVKLKDQDVERAHFPAGITHYLVFTGDDEGSDDGFEQEDPIVANYAHAFDLLANRVSLMFPDLKVQQWFDFVHRLRLRFQREHGELAPLGLDFEFVASHFIYSVLYKLDPATAQAAAEAIFAEVGDSVLRIAEDTLKTVASYFQTRLALDLIPETIIGDACHQANRRLRTRQKPTDFDWLVPLGYKIPMIFDVIVSLVTIFPRELLRGAGTSPLLSYQKYVFIEKFLGASRRFLSFYANIMVHYGTNDRLWHRSNRVVQLLLRVDRTYSKEDKHPLRSFFKNFGERIGLIKSTFKGKGPAVQQMQRMMSAVLPREPPPSTEPEMGLRELIRTIGEIPPLTKTFLKNANDTFADSKAAINNTTEKVNGLVDHITSGDVYKKVGSVVSGAFTTGFENTSLSNSVVSAIAGVGGTISWVKDFLVSIYHLAPLLVPVVFALSYAALRKEWSTSVAFVCGASALYTFIHYFSVIKDSALIHRIQSAMSMMLTGKMDVRPDAIPLVDESEDSVAEQHAGLFDLDNETVGSLFAIFSSLGFSKAESKKSLFFNTMKDVGSTSRGAGTIITAAMKLLSAFADDFKSVLGFTTDDKDFTIEAFSTEVTTLIAETRSGILAVSTYQLNRGISLHKRGLEICDLLAKRKDNQHLPTMNRILKTLEDVIQKMRDLLGQACKARAQPVSIVAKGTPGQGKTFLMRYIETVLFKFEMELIKDPKVREAMMAAYKEKPATYLYHKGQDYYYDGISPCAMIVTLDDWLQRPGVKGGDYAPLMDFISAVNTEAWFPRMAFSKEEKSVAPRYVLATTNATEFHDETVKEPDAVYRRCDFTLNVSLKEHRSKLEGFSTDVYNLVVQEWLPIHDAQDTYDRHGRKIVAEKGKFVDIGTMKVPELIIKVVELRQKRAKQLQQVGDDMDARAEKEMVSLRDFLAANPQLAPDYVAAARQQCGLSREVLDDIALCDESFPEVNDEQFDKILDTYANDPMVEAPNELVHASVRNVMADVGPVLRADVDAFDQTQKWMQYMRDTKTVSVQQGAELSVPRNGSDVPRDFEHFTGPNMTVKEFKQLFPATVTSEPDDTVMDYATYSKMFPAGFLPVRAEPIRKIPHPKNNQVHVIKEGKEWITIVNPVARRQGSGPVGVLRRAIYFATGALLTTVTISSIFLGCAIHIGKLTLADANKIVAGGIHRMALRIRDVLTPSLSEVKATLSNAFNSLKEGMYNAMQWLKDFFAEHKHAIGLACAAIVPVAALFFGIKGLKNDEETVAVSHESESVFRHIQKLGPQKPKMPVRQLVKGVHQQMGFVQHDNVCEVLRKNMWEIYAWNGSDYNRLGYINFVADNVAHMPYHFIGRVTHHLVAIGADKTHNHYILKQEGCRDVTVSMDDILTLNKGASEEDKVIVRIATRELPNMRNVLAHYVTDAEMGKGAYNSLDGFTGQILQPKEKQATPVQGFAGRSIRTMNDRGEEVISFVPNLLKYNFPMTYGDCGSLVMNVDGTSGGRVVGAHIAGDEKKNLPAYGYSYRITREEILRAVGHAVDDCYFPLVNMPDFNVALAGNAYAEVAVKCAYDVNVHKFAVNLDVTPASGTHTNCQIVEFQGATAPYVERKTEICDTRPANYPQAREPYCARVLDFTESLQEKEPVLTRIAEQLAHELSKIPWARSKSLQSFHQALGKSELSTSAGYPYMAIGQPKKSVVRKEVDGSLVPGKNAKQFAKKCEDNLNQLSEGMLPMWIYQDCLKVERRKFSKKRAPRLVSGAPFDAAITGCMLFGAFSDFMCETTLDNETLIGFDPYTQAQGFTERFMRFGNFDNIACLDYSGYDTDHNAIMIMLAIHVINLWYDDHPSHQRARETYGRSIANSYHIRGTVLEQWPGSMPSGNYLTTLINCLINLINLRYCFYRANDNEISCIPEFQDNVQVEVLGDDNAIAVSIYYVEKMTEEKLAGYLAELGYRATSAQKDQPLAKVMHPIEHLQLLKRSPRRELTLGGRYVLPLSLDTVLEIPLWTKKSQYLEVACTNLETSLHELSLHGQEIWDKYTPGMKAFFEGIYSPKTWNRQYYLERTLKEGFFNLVDLETDLGQQQSMVFEHRRKTGSPPISPSGSAKPVATPATQFSGRMSSNTADPPASDGPYESVPIASAPNSGTTLFLDDTVGSSASIAHETRLDSNIVTAVDEAGSKTITDFLKKPTRIATGSLSSTDVSYVFKVDPFLALLSGVKSQKLSGTFMIRSDIMVTLQINATRFQAGRYILAWLPFGGWQQGSGLLERMHTANLMTITQLPHVEIDIATQTHAQIIIPFQTNLTHTLSTTPASYLGLGTLMLYPYVALQPGSGNTTAPYTVWASFVDPQLSGAAYQMSGKSVGRQEQVKAGVGPISAVAAKVGKSAGILGTIPILAPAMATVSWLSDVVGRVATVWGYSKPPVLSAPQRMVRSVYPYAANADQNTTAFPLALMSTNEVITNTGVSRTNADEMAIDFIKKQWSYVSQFTWTATAIADTLLVSYGHDPSLYYLTMGKGRTYAPVAFVSQFFKYWRGGLKFRIKLVKTEFHSGRLVISYCPGYHGNATWATVASEYLWREVVDIRSASEIEFEVPYVSPELYTQFGIAVGELYIHVLDPLVAPSTVESAIPIIIEVCGADDFEVAVPDFTMNDHGFEPYAPAVSMSGYVVVPPVKLGETTSGPMPSATSIGEKIESFRQLLKRPQFVADFTGSTSTAYVPYSNVIVTQGSTSNTDPLNRCSDGVVADAIANLAPCYLFSSGSMVSKFLPMSGANDLYAVGWWMPATVIGTVFGSTTKAVEPLIDSHYVRADIDGGIDVIAPPYLNRIARQNSQQIANGTITASLGATTTTIRVTNLSGTVNKYRILRSTGDDYHMSGWIGTVPYVYWGST